MKRIKIYPRLTHQYQGGWSHLDQYADEPIKVKIIPGKPRSQQARYYDDSDRVYFRVEAPRGIDNQLLVSAILDTFSGTDCRHEFDCCGCITRSASVKKVGRRTWFVVERSTPNC